VGSHEKPVSVMCLYPGLRNIWARWACPEAAAKKGCLNIFLWKKIHDHFLLFSRCLNSAEKTVTEKCMYVY